MMSQNMELTTAHLLGMALTFLILFIIGVYSGRQVRSVLDFSVSGRKAGSFLVMGTILGTLVGGASTVGTAQLAYLYGFSAWWFTLGGGIGCLIIALFLVKPMRETSFETIPRFIASSFGITAGIVAAIFVSLGMFINIMPQIFSAMALLASIFPIDLRLAALVAVVLSVSYVVFGGAWGTGLMGSGKIILTCLAMIVSGMAALFLAGGPAAVSAYFEPFPWFSLFGRGLNTDMAAAFSLLVGVLSSQIYFQGIFCSKSISAARGGALLSAFLAPLIGLGGIMVGLYMRMYFPDINPIQALPLFVTMKLPDWFAGIVLATLLLASIGTAAGLTLGVSTMLNRDIFLKLRPNADDRTTLFVFRILIVIIMGLALVVTLIAGSNVLILNWSYLSLGLRGAAICFPLLAAIFFRDKITPWAGAAAVILGPSVVIIGLLIDTDLNPLYAGLVISLLLLLLGYLHNGHKHWKRQAITNGRTKREKSEI